MLRRETLHKRRLGLAFGLFDRNLSTVVIETLKNAPSGIERIKRAAFLIPDNRQFQETSRKPLVGRRAAFGAKLENPLALVFPQAFGLFIVRPSLTQAPISMVPAPVNHQRASPVKLAVERTERVKIRPIFGMITVALGPNRQSVNPLAECVEFG